MATTNHHRIVLVTAPLPAVGRNLSNKILTARLAACVNLIPGIESHYWWQDRLETASEILLLIKTTDTNLKPLRRLIKEEHPYDTPEFVVLPLNGGSRRYLNWIDANVLPAAKPVAGKRG